MIKWEKIGFRSMESESESEFGYYSISEIDYLKSECGKFYMVKWEGSHWLELNVVGSVFYDEHYYLEEKIYYLT
jgi:hypothetical protein